MTVLHVGWEVFQVENWLFPITRLMGWKESVELGAGPSHPAGRSTPRAAVRPPASSLLFSGRACRPHILSVGTRAALQCSELSFHARRHVPGILHTRRLVSFPHNSTRRALLLAPLSRGGNRVRESERTCQRPPGWRGWHRHSDSHLSDANGLGASDYFACWRRERMMEGEQVIFLSPIPAAQNGVGSSGTRLSRCVLGPRSS